VCARRGGKRWQWNKKKRLTNLLSKSKNIPRRSTATYSEMDLFKTEVEGVDFAAKLSNSGKRGGELRQESLLIVQRKRKGS